MRLHANPIYRRNAQLVRNWANADPTTKCWRCHRTQTQHQRPWHAGHTIDGDPLAQPWLSNHEPPTGSWLRPECEQCNTREGGYRAHTIGRKQSTTRQW